MFKRMLLCLTVLYATLSIPSAIADAVSMDYKGTYSASSTAVVPPATPTDICTITGSATRTIKVTKVEVSSTQTTAGVNTFFLIKRSAADTGGTHAGTFDIVPHDSKVGAATATVLAYTANPTAGTAVGNLRALHLLSPAPAGTAAIPMIWDFDHENMSTPIVLHGIAEVLAINFGGAALPTGLSVNCNFEWIEY